MGEGQPRRKVESSHAWGVVALGLGLFAGVPAVEATVRNPGDPLHWWFAPGLVLSALLIVGGVVLLFVPVRPAAAPPSPVPPPEPEAEPGEVELRRLWAESEGLHQALRDVQGYWVSRQVGRRRYAPIRVGSEAAVPEELKALGLRWREAVMAALADWPAWRTHFMNNVQTEPDDDRLIADLLDQIQRFDLIVSKVLGTAPLFDHSPHTR